MSGLFSFFFTGFQPGKLYLIQVAPPWPPAVGILPPTMENGQLQKTAELNKERIGASIRVLATGYRIPLKQTFKINSCACYLLTIC